MGPDPSPRIYLPLFYDLTRKAVHIVGGGRAAWQKRKALSPFGVAVVIVSPEFHPDLAASAPDSRLTLIRKPWDEADLDHPAPLPPAGLVLACTADPEVNARVLAAARSRGLPVLDAAAPENGDFIQPAARKTGSFTLAVSSGGVGPRAAVAVREALAEPFDAAVKVASEGS